MNVSDILASWQSVNTALSQRFGVPVDALV